MSSRAHLWLRIGAVVLLAGVTMWPRSRSSSPEAASATAATHAAVRAVETAQAKRVERPRPAKLVVADADESRLTN